MACKYLTQRRRQAPPEIGGGAFPSGYTEPACALGRDKHWVIGGNALNCEQTPSQGPCWLWVEQRGNTPDIQFQRGR